jgi:hypothetical protein
MVAEAIWVFIFLIFNHFEIYVEKTFPNNVNLFEIVSLCMLFNFSKFYHYLWVTAVFDFDWARCVYAESMILIFQLRFIGILWCSTYPWKHEKVSCAIIIVGFMGSDDSVSVENKMKDPSSCFWTDDDEIIFVDLYIHRLIIM